MTKLTLAVQTKEVKEEFIKYFEYLRDEPKPPENNNSSLIAKGQENRRHGDRPFTPEKLIGLFNRSSVSTIALENWNASAFNVADASKHDIALLGSIFYYLFDDIDGAIEVFKQSPYYPTRLEQDGKTAKQYETELIETAKNAVNWGAQKYHKDVLEYYGTETKPSTEPETCNDDDEELLDDELLEISSSVPQLPDNAQIDYNLGKGVCTWFDDAVKECAIYSPRTFDGFHTATVLWTLVTAAAGRVSSDLLGTHKTSINIAMVGDSGLTKSTTARFGKTVLEKAGLNFLFLPDRTTTEALLQNMGGHVRSDFNELPADEKENEAASICFANVRGWYMDELGKEIRIMKRDGSNSNGLLSVILTFSDATEYKNITKHNGNDYIKNPYLATLGNSTPTDIEPLIKNKSDLWTDGFFARMLFVTPPKGFKAPKGRTPLGYEIPDRIVKPLIDWHTRLGIPESGCIDAITEQIIIEPVPHTKLHFSGDAYEAFYGYYDGLVDIADELDQPLMKANYQRFANFAARLAVLFASFDGYATVELKHWAKAQQIIEQFRGYLHDLFDNVTNSSGLNQYEELQNRVGKALATPTAFKRNGHTFPELEKALKLDNPAQLLKVLKYMGNENVGLIESYTTKQGKERFKLTKDGLTVYKREK